MEWEAGVSRCKLLCTERIDNKVLLYSMENSIQYPVTNHHEKAYEKEYIMYILCTCVIYIYN